MAAVAKQALTMSTVPSVALFTLRSLAAALERNLYTPERLKLLGGNVYSVLCDLMRARSKVYSCEKMRVYFLEIAKIQTNSSKTPV